MSPEQVSSQPVDARSDLYSLGVTFYHMVTGRRPFQGESEAAVLAAQMMLASVPPAEVNPGVPATLSALIMKALEKDPAHRFQTAEEFQAVLRGEAELQPRRSDRSPSNWSSGRRRAVRTRRNCAGHWRSTSPATPSGEFFSAPAK